MPIEVKLTDGRTATFPDGMSQADMEAALSQLPPLAEAQTPPEKSWRESIATAMPNVGGMVGSMAGGRAGTIGGIAGSAIGGAAGYGYGQLIRHAAEIPGALVDVGRNLVNEPVATMRGALQGMGEGAAEAGISGAVQGAVDAVGRGVVQPVAKGLYGLALRPIKTFRDKYGTKALLDTGFAQRILPTKGGAAKAMSRVTASKAEQEGMARAFDQSGGQLPSTMRTVHESLSPMIAQARLAERAAGTSPAGRQAILDAGKNVVRDNPARLSAQQMIELKHSADRLADPAYRLAERTGVSVPQASEAGIAKGMSKGYRQTLNKAIGPKYTAKGLQTKALYGVSKAADYAAERPQMLTNVLSGGAGLLTSSGDPGTALQNSLMVRAAASPAIQAGAALAATPLALYGTRALDLGLGSPLEQMLREALLEQLTGNAGQ